jgi:hypothetical protein
MDHSQTGLLARPAQMLAPSCIGIFARARPSAVDCGSPCLCTDQECRSAVNCLSIGARRVPTRWMTSADHSAWAQDAVAPQVGSRQVACHCWSSAPTVTAHTLSGAVLCGPRNWGQKPSRIQNRLNRGCSIPVAASCQGHGRSPGLTVHGRHRAGARAAWRLKAGESDQHSGSSMVLRATLDRCLEGHSVGSNMRTTVWRKRLD